MAKWARMEGGGRGEKRRPTAPRRCGVRRERLGWDSVEGVRPRATAMTFVLPKKSLFLGGEGGVVRVGFCLEGGLFFSFFAFWERR